MEFGKESWRTYEQGIQKEWLLTNGIGSFASSTVIGANTRRYHGLLVASLSPPVMRHLILSKLDESITVEGNTYNLYTNETIGYISDGYKYLQRFSMSPVPTYVYNVGDIFIEKKVCMVYGKNQVVVVYRITNGQSKCTMRIAPLVNFRDYHFNSSYHNLKFQQDNREAGVILKPENYNISIFINSSKGLFIHGQNIYFNNMSYAIERERGLNAVEDHYIPGWFEIEVEPEQEKTITITAGLGETQEADGEKIIAAEGGRLHALEKNAGLGDPFAAALVRASDAFIVYRQSTNSKTVIAGYPWFTDWGRDTMIALPGLTLVTKRFDDAKDILYTFSRYIKHGMVPNMFPDAQEEPGYNTVDGALWYIYAVYKYLQYTNDYEFIKENIYDKMEEIIYSYKKGTLYDIKMDQDGLIRAGSPSTQLTWMDAKVGDWIVTPRYGKAVEINALWYNALNIMAQISARIGKDGSEYAHIASKAKQSFMAEFWNEEKQCLFDVINEEGKDDKIRPNQILAVSLDFSLLDEEKALQVVNVVLKQLYATYGLRTLSPDHHEYKGVYKGDQWYRDGSYHQGTAWSWLMGHFISAYRKAHKYSEESKQRCLKFIYPFKDHLKDACIGSISEIFDGDFPNIPRGCFAQAWGVAEILRAYVEDILNIKPYERNNNLMPH